MAIYEYYCMTCDVRYEARRPMSESSATFHCPECQGEAMKTISLFNATLGGDGVALGMGLCEGGACACAADGVCQAEV